MTVVTDDRIPRIKGTSITILDVQRAREQHDLSPSEIAETFDLNESDIKEALIWIRDNPDEVERAEDAEDAKWQDWNERVVSPEDVI